MLRALPILTVVLLGLDTTGLAQRSARGQPVLQVTPTAQEPQAAPISSIMLLDRLAQLEASARGIDRRVDDARNLTLTLFGGLVAILAAIGVPVIFRERRDLRELREMGVLEREKITSQLTGALAELQKQIATVKDKLTAETDALRQGLVENLRAQMLAMQQQFELTITSQKADFVQSASPAIAKEAMARVEAQLQTYSRALQGLSAEPSPVDHILRATFYLAQEGPDHARAAAAEAKRALELDPNSADAFLLLSQALSRSGETDEAWTTIHRARDLSPTDPRIIKEIIVTALRTERYDDALRAIDDFERLGDYSDRAWLVGAQATALRRQGRHREGIEALSRLLADQPHLSGIRAQLAEALLDAELFADAARATTEGLAINPTDHQLTVLRARAHAGLGEYDEALGDLEVAERENPRDVKVFLTRARIHYAREDFAASAEACRKGLSQRSPEGLRALLYVGLAQALLRLHQVGPAVGAAEQAVALGRHYVVNHMVLVQCLFCADRLDQALLAAGEALTLAKTPATKAILLLFTALTTYAMHKLSTQADRTAAQFSSALTGVELQWDIPFLRSVVEARTEHEAVRRRMLDLLELVAGSK